MLEQLCVCASWSCSQKKLRHTKLMNNNMKWQNNSAGFKNSRWVALRMYRCWFTPNPPCRMMSLTQTESRSQTRAQRRARATSGSENMNMKHAKSRNQDVIYEKNTGGWNTLERYVCMSTHTAHLWKGGSREWHIYPVLDEAKKIRLIHR